MQACYKVGLIESIRTELILRAIQDFARLQLRFLNVKYCVSLKGTDAKYQLIFRVRMIAVETKFNSTMNLGSLQGIEQ